jgi:hypothetical protein
MEIMEPEGPTGLDQNGKAAELRFCRQLEHRFIALKADVLKRPFLFCAIAFIAGFASNTFPARILFRVIVRLISWLLGPAILVMGVVKLSDLFCSPQRSELTVLQKP